VIRISADPLTGWQTPTTVKSVPIQRVSGGAIMLGELLVQPSATTVRLHGELDLVTVEALRALLAEAAADAPPKVVVDINDVPFVDVLSLSTILAAADGMRERGGALLVVGASQSVRRLFDVLNAGDVLAPALPMPRVASS
jgi:anti-sigma B factor antagonist